MTESARRSDKRDAGHPVWFYKGFRWRVSPYSQFYNYAFYHCSSYIVIPNFNRFATLAHNSSPSYNHTSTSQPPNHYLHFTNIHRSNSVHARLYHTHHSPNRTPSTFHLPTTNLQQYDRFMFISLLTFLCFVAILEEYMFLFITCSNLICLLLFMSIHMEWEKFLFLFLFHSAIFTM